MDVLYFCPKATWLPRFESAKCEELTSLCNWKKAVSWDFEWDDEMSGGTPCQEVWAEGHSNPALYPQTEKGVPNKPASILKVCDISWSSFLRFNISISMSQVWDLPIWWFARLLCKAFAAFWNCEELMVWNLEWRMGQVQRISEVVEVWTQQRLRPFYAEWVERHSLSLSIDMCNLAKLLLFLPTFYHSLWLSRWFRKQKILHDYHQNISEHNRTIRSILVHPSSHIIWPRLRQSEATPWEV